MGFALIYASRHLIFSNVGLFFVFISLQVTWRAQNCPIGRKMDLISALNFHKIEGGT